MFVALHKFKIPLPPEDVDFSRRQQQEWKQGKYAQELAEGNVATSKSKRGRGRGGRGRGGKTGRGGCGTNGRGKSAQTGRGRGGKPGRGRGGKPGRGSETKGRGSRGGMKKPAAAAPRTRKQAQSKPQHEPKDAHSGDAPELPSNKDEQDASQQASDEQHPAQQPVKRARKQPEAANKKSENAKQKQKAAQQNKTAGNDGVGEPEEVKATFARRYCPNKGTNALKWHALREVFETYVAPSLKRPSTQEDAPIFVVGYDLKYIYIYIYHPAPLQGCLLEVLGCSLPGRGVR